MQITRLAPRHGFTLVELAVVLVIIGLLVGGLLGTASIMRNARLSTMMNESKYYTNAFIQFQTRYNAPPGDYATASLTWVADAAGHNGDGNGLIRAGTVAVPLERYYAFQHLALASFIQGKYTGAGDTGGTGATIGRNVPGSAIDNSAFVFDHPDALDGVVSGETYYFDGVYGNVLRIAGLNPGATTEPDQLFLTPKQALQVDEKFDDGLPGEGNVMTQKGTATCAPSSTVYVTATESPACSLIIRMQ